MTCSVQVQNWNSWNTEVEGWTYLVLWCSSMTCNVQVQNWNSCNTEVKDGRVSYYGVRQWLARFRFKTGKAATVRSKDGLVLYYSVRQWLAVFRFKTGIAATRRSKDGHVSYYGVRQWLTRVSPRLSPYQMIPPSLWFERRDLTSDHCHVTPWVEVAFTWTLWTGSGCRYTWTGAVRLYKHCLVGATGV